MVRRKKNPSKPLEQTPCKNCGRLIPKPMVFCSSKCNREYKEEKAKNWKWVD